MRFESKESFNTFILRDKKNIKSTWNFKRYKNRVEPWASSFQDNTED